MVISIKDPSGQLSEVKRVVRVFRQYLFQDSATSSHSNQGTLATSVLGTASQLSSTPPSESPLSGSPPGGSSSSLPSAPFQPINGGSGSTAGPAALLGSGTPPARDTLAPSEAALGKSELDLKDPGFSMALLLPLAVACILIWLLQASNSIFYSPWATFILGTLAAYIHFRLVNPRKSQPITAAPVSHSRKKVS